MMNMKNTVVPQNYNDEQVELAKVSNNSSSQKIVNKYQIDDQTKIKVRSDKMRAQKNTTNLLRELKLLKIPLEDAYASNNKVFDTTRSGKSVITKTENQMIPNITL